MCSLYENSSEQRSEGDVIQHVESVVQKAINNVLKGMLVLISLHYVRAPSTATFIWTGASVKQSQISWPVPISSGIHTTLATTTTI